MPIAALAGALVGRDQETATLVRLVTEVTRGRGSSVLIEGEPGIGKSSLVRAALAEPAGLGCQVFWGAGDELGQALPLLPLLEGLRVREPSANPRREMILRLLQGDFAADRGTDVSAALSEQLLALVAEQCTTSPTVLVVDDLQWADPATVALWRRLARSAPQLPLLLIGMMRPVPVRDDLLAVRNMPDVATRIQLTGIGDEEAAELITALAGGQPDTQLMRLADGAAGNPLYLTELVAALDRSSSLIVTRSGSAKLTSGPVPNSLSAAIADRLGFVPSSVREVLRAAALLGVEFAVPDLAIVLGRGVAELVPAVDEACAAGVLAESGNSLGFRHPVIRAALYGEIPAPLRAAWHRDAARALAEAGAPADRVARQLLGAVSGSDGTADPMDEWILSWLTQTAELLVRQAPRAGAELLQHAVASSPAGSPQHDLLVSRLADALYRVGDTASAEQLANRVLGPNVDPDVLLDLHWTLAQCRMMAGRSADSLATLAQALAVPGIPTRHRARLLVLTARTHSILGNVETAGVAAADALKAATEAGDNWAMGWALHVLSLVMGMRGNMNEALPLFDQALTVTQGDAALTSLRLLLQINKAITLSNIDRYEEAFAAAREAQQLADRAGTVVQLGNAHSALGQLLFDTGQWDEALAEVQVLQEDLKEPGAACIDRGVAAVICFHRGEIAAARDHLSAAAPNARRIGNRLIGTLTLARTLDAEQAGAVPDALAVLTDGFAEHKDELEELEDLFADAVRLALAADDPETARAFTGHAEALAAGSDVPHRQANARYCRGLLNHDAAELMRAADQYGEASRMLLQAKALEAAASEFIVTDDRGQARGAFTKAVELYSALGAVTDVARLQTIFRAHGIRRGPHAKHRQARSGWDSLTPTEVKVASLVGDGLSNPEIAAKLFLSRRTVATHVSHILKKLNVHSRTDIAREAALRAAGAS